MVLVAGVVASLMLSTEVPLAMTGLAVAALLLPPVPVLVCVAVWAGIMRARSASPHEAADAEADVLRGLAAELTAGASLRSALNEAASRSPDIDLSEAARLAAAGLPMSAVADSVRRSLPVNGALAGPALLLAAKTGAPVSRLAGDLAIRATDEGRLARERRALTAQARASAFVVGGAPILLVIAAALTGRLTALIDTAAGPVILGVGVGLQAIGMAVIWSMVRRAT